MDQGSITRAMAKSEIETLLHRYAILAKENAPFAEMARLFKEDGAFRLPDGVAVKPAQIEEVVQGNEPSFIRHHITSVDVRFDSEYKADAQSYFFAITHASSLDHWGYWKDVMMRDADGQWLIADRSVVVEGVDPNGWYKANYAV